MISSLWKRKLVFYWTALSIVVLGCAIAFAQDEDQDPPPEAGRLSAINGNVSVQPAGAQDWGQAYPNLPLGPGDRIYTDQDSRAEIQIGQTYLRVGPNTDVTLVDATSQTITIGLGAGSLDVQAYGLWPNQQLQVQTPSGTATVYQPANFRTDVYPDQQSAVFTPFSGSLDVAGADDVGATVQYGQSFELAGTDPVYPQWLEPAPPDDLDQWSQRRDYLVSRARSYQYMSRGMPGGYELDAAGQWQGGTEYGNIWFPNVDPGWAPYRNGHWINRDPWGWVWVEDEPWGYAPFHYGRWVNYRGRWGWIPGPQQEHPVWSPALVVFAGGVHGGGGGGGASLSIWIPLGPGEPFRPWYRASPAYINRVNISNIQPAPRVQVQNTYVNITNVNVTNITYVNRTSGATAVSREAFASGRPVQQAVVHVTPQQMQQVRVVERPEVQPTRANLISRPVTKPVPVQARPVMINAKGMAVAAQPHAKPEAPQVRQTVAPQPIPGRKAMAPPPNAKMTPGAQKAAQQMPPPGTAAKPGQTNPQQPQRGNQPGQQPGMPAQTGRPTTQQQPNQPGAVPQRPAPGQPNDRLGQKPPAQPERPGTTPQKPGTEQPNAHPGQQTPAAPGQRPTPAPQRPGTQQQPQPGHPAPQSTQPVPQKQPAPAPHPGAPSQQTNPPQRPATQPPAQSKPDNHQAPPQQRPAPEQRPTPGQQPPAKPDNRPAPQQRPAPEQRPAPTPDTNRPNTEAQPKKPAPDKTKPDQTKPDQTKQDQTKPDQKKPDKPKPNQPDQNQPQ